MYRSALILGLGLSGRAAARLLLTEGTAVTAVDTRDDAEIAAHARALANAGVAVRTGCREVPGGAFDACIVSPGLAVDTPLVQGAAAQGIELLSELELGARRCPWPIVAVTGSKGKSTFVKLCGEALARAGLRVKLAGNYGVPLCAVVADGLEQDWVVTEVSSFQLEHVRQFRPRVGVLLNIQPDHLDRHGTMENYMALKARLFAGMGAGDTGIVSAADLAGIARRAGGQNRWTSFGDSSSVEYRYANGTVRFRRAGVETGISVRGTYFHNEILGLTAAAAVAALEACGVGAGAVEAAAAAFEPLPHRMQPVAVINGVRFVNDSKATNLAALCAGVAMCPGAVRLIAGGRLKEKKLESAGETLRLKVQRIYVIGEAASDMEAAWRGTVSCRRCGRLDQAVRAAFADAVAGETVLLSPGCASFDQFKNFEDRGNQFMAAVTSLQGGGSR